MSACPGCSALTGESGARFKLLCGAGFCTSEQRPAEAPPERKTVPCERCGKLTEVTFIGDHARYFCSDACSLVWGEGFARDRERASTTSQTILNTLKGDNDERTGVDAARDLAGVRRVQRDGCDDRAGDGVAGGVHAVQERAGERGSESAGSASTGREERSGVTAGPNASDPRIGPACDRCGVRGERLENIETFLFCFNRSACETRKIKAADSSGAAESPDDVYARGYLAGVKWANAGVRPALKELLEMMTRQEKRLLAGQKGGVTR